MEYSKLRADKIWLGSIDVLKKLNWTNMSYREFKSPVPVPDPVVRVDQPLSIGQLGVAFMALGAALTMALMVFFGELCMKAFHVS